MGLNLTRANLALLVDPSYNPCTEDQAMDRVYRFGQERDVRVVRFMAPLTAEADVDRARQAKAHLARLFVEAAFTRLCSRAPFVYVDDDRDGNDAREAGNRNPPCTRREKRTHPPMAEAKTSSADPDVTGSLLSVGISSASADGSPPAKRRKLGPAQADANRCDVAPPPPGDEATCTLAERVRDAAAADEFFGFVCPFGAAAACDKGRPSLSPKGRKRKRTEGESPQPSRLSPAGQGQKKKDDGK